MEAMEIVVYMLVALVVGSLMLVFINKIDLPGIGDDVGKTVLNQHGHSFKTVDWTGFLHELLDFWQEHQLSDDKSQMVIYLEGDGVLDKARLFETIKGSNLCRTLQSKAFGCGTREDVRLGSVPLPQVILIAYENNTLIVNQEAITGGATRNLHMLRIPLGGFEGNGDMTRRVQGVPASSKIVLMRLSLLAGADFTLLFNGQECGSYLVYPEENVWDITNCSSLLAPGGQNEMTIKFLTDELWRKYVAGGQLTIVYDSPQAVAAEQRQYLPAIDGTINYFGGVTFGGTPNSMNICLHYSVGDLQGMDMYVTVNGQTVYQDSTPNHEQTLTCIPVGAGILKPGINPVRIGINSQISNVKNIFLPQPVDSVLITDQSGSMRCDLDSLHPQDCIDKGDNGAIRTCTDAQLLSDQTEKLSLAKCFGKEFVKIILDKYDKNRIGLVSFHQNVEHGLVLPLESDKYKIEETLMRYDPSGGTCLSCAIAKALEILKTSPKVRAMVIMTDGVANHCIPGFECGEGPAAAEAIAYATNATKENISLFAIAFGLNDPQGQALLRDIACLDNCSNFDFGNTPEKIKSIYTNFAEKIAQKKTVVTRFVQGSPEEKFAQARLYGDSYIELIPSPSESSAVRVLVAKKLGCPDTFDLPPSMQIVDCAINSVAGKDWTDKISLNGQVIYDFLQYSNPNYYLIGDPAVMGLPLDQLKARNTIEVKSGYAESPQSKCLANNTVFYTAELPQSLITQNTFRSAEGCHWTIPFPDSAKSITIPLSYVGDNFCEYSQNPKYDAADLYQFAAAALLKDLDADSDGVVDDTFDWAYVLG